MVALLVLFSVLYSIYGRRVRVWWRIRTLKKYHKLFLDDFEKGMEQLVAFASPEPCERQLALWKSYQETLLKVPVAKWTTKEIVHYFPGWNCEDALRQIDRSIYAMQWSEKVPDAFSVLLQQSEDTFEKVIGNLKSAKDGE
jgi:hypothetical protein